MDTRFELVLVRNAYDDLLQRTLSKISSNLERLIFLASTRDCNTGSYCHEGLASRFSARDASAALEKAHIEVFNRLSSYSLEELVVELELYARDSRQSFTELIRTWQILEPYRIAVPLQSHPTLSHLFMSNVRLALAVLKHRQKEASASPSSASPRQLPDQ